MKRLGSIGTTNAESAEINLSPLIDMVFLLLIFFMVTTVFVQETGVEVEKPRAASAEDLQKHAVLLAVTRDGAIAYGGQTIGLSRVRGLVARLLTVREMPVIILADEGSATGRVVEVIDQCKLGGAKQVSLAARRD
ncbi:MAG: biopolymer transporter ExbD [Lentisphaeria bacterium]|nr:biopolymer transporter ExbD [Lentisphaeria bacterium]